jgi:hypothetical protein
VNTRQPGEYVKPNDGIVSFLLTFSLETLSNIKKVDRQLPPTFITRAKAARSAASTLPNVWFKRCRARGTGFPVVEDAQESDPDLTIIGNPRNVG